MQVSSRVTINSQRLRQLSQAAINALEKTGEALHTEIANAEVVPMDKGTLTGDAFFCDYSESSSGKVILSHSVPYARRLYYHPEYHFSTDEHANAKGKWFEDWMEGGKEEGFAKKAFKDFYRREADL